MRRQHRTLSARWESADGAALAARVLEALASDRDLGALPLDRIDGRLDLRGFRLSDGARGFTVPVPGTRRHVEVRDRPRQVRVTVALGAVDWTGADLRAWRFVGSSFEDSLFDDADLRDVYIASASFRHCSFRRADLSGATLAVMDWNVEPVRFEVCVFDDARLVHSFSGNGAYAKCSFVDVLIRKSDFTSSRFRDCTFTGLLDDVQFSARFSAAPDDAPRNDMAGVDFSAATLRWVSFRDIDLGRVALPREPEHIILRHARCSMSAALERLRDASSPRERSLRGLLRHDLERLVGDTAVLHRLDAGYDDENDARWAEAFLRDLDRACAGATANAAPGRHLG